MRHLTYLAVLAACLAGALWLEPVLRVNVLRRWRRLLLTIAAVVIGVAVLRRRAALRDCRVRGGPGGTRDTRR